jgi:uncharacterized protein YndB with AHSA1/START domain
MGNAFELTHDIDLNATPEEVWEAIATGPGIDAWFMGRTEVEPREGGHATMTMGEMFTAESTVTAYEPPRRFKFEGEPGDDGAFMAFEYLIEGREGGSSHLRLVHSGFLGGDNWEDEYNALRKGNPLYLLTLAQYLDHFRGRTATPVSAFPVPPKDSEAEAWGAITAAVGVSPSVQAGDPVHFTVDGETFDGVVDTVLSPSFLGVRTEDALLRFVGRQGVIGLGHHLFSDVDEKQATDTWSAWLTRAWG